MKKNISENSVIDKSIIEIYKELGTFERHFNQIQNVFKGLASTWFLAAFAAIGFIYSKSFPCGFPTMYELASSLVSLTVATVIIMFWIMDVLIYHKLLLASLKKSKKIEKKNKDYPKLRKTMNRYTKLLNVRTASSIFYITPSFILFVTASFFLIKCWTDNGIYVNVFLTVWLFALFVGYIIILVTQNRKGSKSIPSNI
ncbi:MAG: hypothetical protein V2B15_21385 [Bacteroidota bacterium]